MKRILVFVLSMLLCLILVSCGGPSSFTKNSVRSQTSNSFYAKYDLLRGDREYTIKVGDKSVAVTVDITTDDGDIAITIAKTGSEPDYTGNNVPTSHFVVTLHEKGTYKVQIHANDHKGGYSFKWEDVK